MKMEVSPDASTDANAVDTSGVYTPQAAKYPQTRVHPRSQGVHSSSAHKPFVHLLPVIYILMYTHFADVRPLEMSAHEKPT